MIRNQQLNLEYEGIRSREDLCRSKSKITLNWQEVHQPTQPNIRLARPGKARLKKFTVRVGEDTLWAAKEYADEHDKTLTDLVDAFFRSIQRVKEIETDTPILSQLAGILRSDTSNEDYHAFLENKYLGTDQPDSK